MMTFHKINMIFYGKSVPSSNLIILKTSITGHVNPMGGGVNISIAREIEMRHEFYKNILAKEEFQPLVKLRDKLYLSNYLTNTCDVYQLDGTFLRSFPIDYHHQKGWKKTLIVDEEEEHIYAKKLVDGMAYLMEINLENGSINTETKLEKHIFPAAIKVKNQKVYYLYKVPDYFTETNLYVQTLN